MTSKTIGVPLSDILPIYKVWKFSVEKYSSYRSTKCGQTDEQTDDVITIGHWHFSMWGPNKVSFKQIAAK